MEFKICLHYNGRNILSCITPVFLQLESLNFQVLYISNCTFKFKKTVTINTKMCDKAVILSENLLGPDSSAKCVQYGFLGHQSLSESLPDTYRGGRGIL